MTTHPHDPSIGAADAPRQSVGADRPQSRPARPPWLLPGLAAALVAIGLVVAGVVSVSTVLFVAAFGGMLLMHLGGHGHGGRGHGGDGAHGGDGSIRGEDLSGRSGGSQPERSASHHEFDDRVSNDQTRSETTDDDQHGSHGCH